MPYRPLLVTGLFSIVISPPELAIETEIPSLELPALLSILLFAIVALLPSARLIEIPEPILLVMMLSSTTALPVAALPP